MQLSVQNCNWLLMRLMLKWNRVFQALSNFYADNLTCYVISNLESCSSYCELKSSMCASYWYASSSIWLEGGRVKTCVTFLNVLMLIGAFWKPNQQQSLVNYVSQMVNYLVYSKVNCLHIQMLFKTPSLSAAIQQLILIFYILTDFNDPAEFWAVTNRHSSPGNCWYPRCPYWCTTWVWSRRFRFVHF